MKTSIETNSAFGGDTFRLASGADGSTLHWGDESVALNEGQADRAAELVEMDNVGPLCALFCAALHA